MDEQSERDARKIRVARLAERVDQTITATHRRLGFDIYATARHYRLSPSDIAFIVAPPEATS